MTLRHARSRRTGAQAPYDSTGRSDASAARSPTCPQAPSESTKSKYTADRKIPGAFEGETVTRRRFMSGTAHTRRRRRRRGLPAARARLRRSARSSRSTSRAGRPSARSTTSPTTPTSRRSSRSSTASARPARPRSTCASATRQLDTEQAPTSTTSSSRSPRAACTSAARCATSRPPQRFICPCHGGVYDFNGKVAGGPPVRPLDRFYTRVAQRPGRGRPALLGQPRAASASRRATPASRSTASASTCTRRALPIRKLPRT